VIRQREQAAGLLGQPAPHGQPLQLRPQALHLRLARGQPCRGRELRRPQRTPRVGRYLGSGSRGCWSDASIAADNSLGGSEPVLYFPQTSEYPALPDAPVLIRSTLPSGKHRYLVASTAWAINKEADAPVYGHSVTLARLGLRPGENAAIKYRRAGWRDVLLRGDKVALAVAVAVAVLTVISTALAGFVTYQDHPRGSGAVLTLIVLGVASVAAIISVVQQFLGP